AHDMAGGGTVQDEVRVAQRAELGNVEPFDLRFLGDADLHEALRDGEDHPCDAPRPDEADDDLEHLRDELARPTAAVEQTGDVAADSVPARAVRTVGEESDREDAPGAAHAVDGDRATRVIDL